MSRKRAPVAFEDRSTGPRDLFQAEEGPEPTALPEIVEERPAVRPDGQFACAVCGGPAHFGFGVKLLAGQLGRWACTEHREHVARATSTPKNTR